MVHSIIGSHFVGQLGKPTLPIETMTTGVSPASNVQLQQDHMDTVNCHTTARTIGNHSKTHIGDIPGNDSKCQIKDISSIVQK